jgi:PAS domain S-box-containing protein
MKKQNKQKGKTPFDSLLRAAAEKKLGRSSDIAPDIKEKNSEELLHELQVHQIELEMQNEELRRIQLALEESRERYVDLYDFAPVGYFTFTPEALIKEVNLTAATLLGVARQKLINARFRRMVASKDQDRWDQHFQSVLQQGEKQSCDLALKRADGSPFQAQLESIRLEVNREAFEVHTAVTDMTERKRAEELIQKSEELLKEAQQEAHIGHWELDNVNGTPQWSEEIFYIFGLDPAQSEPSFKAHQKIIHPDDWYIFNNAVTKASIEGIPFDIEFRLLRPDGSIRWMNAKGNITRDGEGHIVRIFGTAQDISERKQAEEGLRLNEALYRGFINSMNSGVAVYRGDKDGSDFVFVDFNKAGEKIDKVKKEDLLGKSVLKIFPNIKEFGLFEILQKVWKTGISERLSEKFYIDQRISGWRENYVYKLSSGEIVVVYEDITERLQAEMLLRESEEKYRSLASTADLMYLVDRKCRYLFTNEKYLEHLDLRGAQIISRIYSEFHSAEDTREFAQIVEEVFDTNKSIQSEHKSENKKSYFLRTFSPVKDQDGKAIIAVTVVSKDITERKRAEEKLYEANSRLQILQQITASVHSTLDLEEVVRQITNSFVYAMGYNSAVIISRSDKKYLFEVKNIFSKKSILTEVDEILGVALKNYSFLVNPGLNAAIDAAMRGEVVVSKTAEEILYPIISKTTCSMLQELGGIRNYILVPLQVDKEVVGGVIITTVREEVSEEEFKTVSIFAQAASQAIQNANLHMLTQQAKEALQVSETKYRVVANNTYDWEFWRSPEGRVLYVSPSCKRITGYAPDEFITDPSILYRLVHPDDRPDYDRHRDEEIQKMVPSEVEFRLVRPDGTVRWIGHTCQPVFAPDGQFLGTRGSNRDITKRKKAEEGLKEAEEKYRNIFENAIEGIFQTTPEGRFLVANAALAHMLGYNAPEELSQGITDIENQLYVNPDRRGELRHILESQDKVEGFECQVYRKDGQLIWGSLNLRAVRNEKGKLLFYEGTAIDITEKINLQTEIMQADRLSTIGELAAGVAHEINNPINGIINYAQMLVDQTQDPGKENDIPQRIIKEGERIASIVNNLLKFARDRREKLQPIPIQTPLNGVLDLVGTQMKKEGIRISIKLPPDLPQVLINSQQIQQVFLNLLSNTRYALNQKYPGFHPKKTLTISGKRIISSQGRPQLRLNFRDAGTGIPNAIMNKIFTPFFTTKLAEKGTGLGLSISRKIIQDHGGRLWLESREGKYTNAIVEWPVAE